MAKLDGDLYPYKLNMKFMLDNISASVAECRAFLLSHVEGKLAILHEQLDQLRAEF